MLFTVGMNAYIMWNMEQVDPVGDFFARAKHHRVAIATLCRRVGIDPTTPSRWRRKKNGANLAKLRLLSQALDAVIAEAREAA